MNWIKLESELDLEKALQESHSNELGIVIFKHSTRCSISAVAKMRLTSFWNFKNELPIYYLDLIAFRDLSALVADKLAVQHESPQLLLVKDGVCIYNASHMSISVKDLRAHLKK